MANNSYNFFNGFEINKNDIFFHNDINKGYSLDANVLKFKTVYPGLVAGIGLPTITEKVEKNKDNSDDYKLSNFQTGINLDYVTGEFRYPASSVKGVLRSVFAHKVTKNKIEYDNLDFIRYVFGNESLTEEKILQIENAIFGEKSDGIYEKNAVIFYDATIEKDKDVTNSDLIDYVTPHKEKTKNPVPIKMIRIPENVIVNIRYSCDEDKLVKVGTNSEEIKRVFINILEFLGIGAKTNQGYGRIEYCDN